MSQRVAWRFGARVVVMLVGLAVLLAACAKDPVRVDRNRPPQTFLVSAPPESGSFSYRIHLYWRGEDPDGFISGFQWAWDDSSVSSFRFTTKTDSIFELTVNDSATIAGGTSDQPPQTSRAHTFFIRAVDNLGKPDPTLSIWNNRIIKSTTVRPVVQFTGAYPSGNGVDSLCDGAPFEVCWGGRDPDGTVIGYMFDVGPSSSEGIIRDSCVTFNDPSDPNSIALSSGLYTLTVVAVDNAYALSDPGASKFLFVVNRDPEAWFKNRDGGRGTPIGYYIQPFFRGDTIAPVPREFGPGATIPFRSTVFWDWGGQDNACDTPSGINAFSLALLRGSRNGGSPYIIGFLPEIAPGIPFETNDPAVLDPNGFSNLVLDSLDAGIGMQMIVRSRDLSNRVSGIPSSGYNGEFVFNCNFKPMLTDFTVADYCFLGQKYKLFSWAAVDEEDGFPQVAELYLENNLETRVIRGRNSAAISERVFRDFSGSNPHIAEVRVQDRGGFYSDERLKITFDVDYADSTCTVP